MYVYTCTYTCVHIYVCHHYRNIPANVFAGSAGPKQTFGVCAWVYVECVWEIVMPLHVWNTWINKRVLCYHRYCSKIYTYTYTHEEQYTNRHTNGIVLGLHLDVNIFLIAPSHDPHAPPLPPSHIQKYIHTCTHKQISQDKEIGRDAWCAHGYLYKNTYMYAYTNANIIYIHVYV